MVLLGTWFVLRSLKESNGSPEIQTPIITQVEESDGLDPKSQWVGTNVFALCLSGSDVALLEGAVEQGGKVHVLIPDEAAQFRDWAAKRGIKGAFVAFGPDHETLARDVAEKLGISTLMPVADLADGFLGKFENGDCSLVVSRLP